MILIIFGYLSLILRTSSCIFHNKWSKGLQDCIDEDRRPATLGDTPLLQENTWVYAARFQLSTGGVIIVQLTRIKKEITELTSEKNCEQENSTFFKEQIVFNKNRSSLISQRQKMNPGTQCTLNDDHFDDYPDPDECMMYDAVDRKFEFRNCSEIQGVQCINETMSEDYTVTACFQENSDGFFCMPELMDEGMDERKPIKADRCPIPTLCLREHVCEIILVGGVLFVYAIISFICITCCVKYQVRRILKKKCNGNVTTLEVDPKMQIYTYKRIDQENWTVQEINNASECFALGCKQTSV